MKHLWFTVGVIMVAYFPCVVIMTSANKMTEKKTPFWEVCQEALGLTFHILVVAWGMRILYLYA